MQFCLSTAARDFQRLGFSPQDVMRSMQTSVSSKLHGQMSCLHCSYSLCVYCQCPHSLCWLQQAEQEFRAKVEAALEANEVDEDQLIEERRRRRQEILAKHGQAQGQAPQPGVQRSAISLAAITLGLLGS